jgi:hypothetical protein
MGRPKESTIMNRRKKHTVGAGHAVLVLAMAKHSMARARELPAPAHVTFSNQSSKELQQ